MMGMKKLKELICLVSMPAFSIIFIAVLLLDAALYHSMYTDMQASFHEVGEARLAWIEQSLQRYVDITEIMEGRVVEKEGKDVPDQAKLADFVKMDAALRSIQLVQADGTFHGYNQDSNIRYFLHVEDSTLGKVAENTRKTEKVSITPSVEVGENLYDIVVLRPVYLTGEDGSRQFWGYIMAIIDTDIFLHDANITNLKDQYVLCGLFHREGDGTIRSLYENGNYSHDALTLERVLFDDIWIIDLRPDGPWVNPWLMILTTWAGVMTALAVGVLLRRNARLRRIGTTDALTGVYNRNGGDWAVKRCLEMHEGRPALVLAVDIDNFKIINDVYGHEAGDRALCQFTKDMKETFGHRAVITRNGGDEFIIFCGYGFTAQAAQAIDTFTSRPHEIIYKGKAVRFFSSLGFARYPDHDTDYRSLCIKADYALYGAKLNGKARWKEFDSRVALEDARTQLGFNLTDIGNQMPGAMIIYRAEDKRILFASSRLVELMKADSLDDFMKYTAMEADRIFPENRRAAMGKEMARQIHNPENRRNSYFLHESILTVKGHLRPVEMIGHLARNDNYGWVYYVFLYEENLEKKLQKK